jgi:hypothetical protein
MKTPFLSTIKAFQDLDQLMEMAKPMVALANTISRKIRDKQGEVSDDETIRFKSYLMSLGKYYNAMERYVIYIVYLTSYILYVPLITQQQAAWAGVGLVN